MITSARTAMPPVAAAARNAATALRADPPVSAAKARSGNPSAA